MNAYKENSWKLSLLLSGNDLFKLTGKMFINKKKKETELKFNPNNNWPLNNWVQGVGVQGEMIIFCGVQV